MGGAAGGPLTKMGLEGKGPVYHDIFRFFFSRPLVGVPF